MDNRTRIVYLSMPVCVVSAVSPGHETEERLPTCWVAPALTTALVEPVQDLVRKVKELRTIVQELIISGRIADL